MTTSVPRRARRRSRQVSVPPTPAAFSSVRLWIVAGVLVAAGIGLVLRLVYLQVTVAPELQERAQQQQLGLVEPNVSRRSVIDRSGKLLAIDKTVYTLYIHPYLFKDSPEAIAAKLAPILNRSVADLVKLFQTDTSGIKIDDSLSEEVGSQLQDLYLDGLELERRSQRLYPQQDLTAEVVGYVDDSHRGQAGIEYSYQKRLQPFVRPIEASHDGSGSLMSDRVPLGFFNVDNLQLQLTLDTRLQRTARFALQQKLKQFNALRGTVITLDAQTGEILSLVSEPSYEPNRYYEFDPGLFKNWAISDLYEPGSTFKPINVAIALEEGAIQPDSVMQDEGRIFVGGWPIQNNDYSYTGARGPLSISQILEVSSNVGMVHIIQQLKSSSYYDWLDRLGIGKGIGTDLPFETPGQFKGKEQFVNYPIEPATTSFGQGFSVTPMQMAQLHAVLANGGQLVTPHIVRGLMDRENKLVWQPPRPAPQKIFSPQTTQSVISMMGNVVEKGTGKPARIPGYRFGGKTGTAQKAGVGGGYSFARITSFVGVFPLEAPRYVVLAVIDEPKGDNAFGSTVAAPIVKSVLETLITTQGIQPSHPQELQKAQPSPKP